MHQNHQRRGGCYCVTYSWPFFICFSTCCRALNTPPTVSPLPAPVHAKKKPGQYRKKTTSPGLCCQSSSSKSCQPSQNSPILKNNLANTPADLKKKRNRKRKEMMGLQRFLLYKLFLSSECDRKIGKFWKRF